jgi:hypothetical protein
VLEALAPVPVALNMKSEDAEALDLGTDSSDDDDDEVEDPGIVSRVMGIFTDLFGGVPPDEDFDGIVSPRGPNRPRPLADSDLSMESPLPVVDSDSGSSGDSMV